MKYVDFNELEGKTLKKIDATDDSITFFTIEGETFRMFHEQDCCESVYVEDVNGDFSDIIGTPIISAKEKTNEDDSCTWTFYDIRTIKGSVTIRWYGTSNGYYSESVDFIRL